LLQQVDHWRNVRAAGVALDEHFCKACG
jgi:hypothetical protein